MTHTSTTHPNKLTQAARARAHDAHIHNTSKQAHTAGTRARARARETHTCTKAHRGDTPQHHQWPHNCRRARTHNDDIVAECLCHIRLVVARVAPARPQALHYYCRLHLRLQPHAPIHRECRRLHRTQVGRSSCRRRELLVRAHSGADSLNVRKKQRRPITCFSISILLSIKLGKQA
jgi:hypothetical protein